LLGIGLLDRPINFFGKQTALVSLVLINTWKFIPFGTLLILAALQTIPSELYEASRVDGANIWQAFYYMIFPLIVPMISFVGFLAFVWNFNVFETIWLITKGGPGNTTMTLPVLIYRKAFGEFRMDEASAVATLVGIILI
jgi:multiple sugar transport system permease protein